ncbi:MAG: hypothetical protein HOF24_07215 [Flavobacteriaceae bacterium]|jgi:hypothetical protein|nr:hypothetical protein [Flavobacteriaceae bacterium]
MIDIKHKIKNLKFANIESKKMILNDVALNLIDNQDILLDSLYRGEAEAYNNQDINKLSEDVDLFKSELQNLIDEMIPLDNI